MTRRSVTTLVLIGTWWAVVGTAPAWAQAGPWGMQAQLRLQLQWQRQQQRLVQRQGRAAKGSPGPKAAKSIARRQVAQEKRLVQMMRKQQQFRLTLLRRITLADQAAMRRIQKVASSVRQPPPSARLRAPAGPSSNVTQANRTERSMPLTPAASLLDALAPLMFLHGRERPSSPPNLGTQAFLPPAPMLVRVPTLPADASPIARRRKLAGLQSEAPLRSIHRPNVSTSSPARVVPAPTGALEGENAVMQLVERIAAGEWRTRKREQSDSSALLPQLIAQAPPRPVLAVAHPLLAPPPEEAFSSAPSSRSSLVEVVLQAPPLPSVP
jgi:hypothetical protein